MLHGEQKTFILLSPVNQPSFFSTNLTRRLVFSFKSFHAWFCRICLQPAANGGGEKGTTIFMFLEKNGKARLDMSVKLNYETYL